MNKTKHRSPDCCKYEKKKNKYNNQIIEIDGIKFRSKKEAKRYSELKLLKNNGLVIDFKMQIPFQVTEKHKYYADFMVCYNDGRIEYEDTKGVRTPLYKIKKQLVKERHGIDIVEL